MCDEETSSIPQRLLVALDASPHSRAALHAAVRLAAALEGTVNGLFVEDERLQRTAELSFTTEVRSYTAPPRHLSTHRLHRQLRRRATHAERALRLTAEPAEVDYAFDTAQGDVLQELTEAADGADLLVIGKTSTDSSRRKLGTTSEALLSAPPCPVLVLRTALSANAPLRLYYDGSPSAEKALRLAVTLAQHGASSPPTVLFPDHDDASPSDLRDRLEAQNEDADIPLRLTPLPQVECRRLSAFAPTNGGILILPADCPALRTTSLEQLLYEADRPLLVVP